MVSFIQKVANVTTKYLLGVLKTPKRYLVVTLATFADFGVVTRPSSSHKLKMAVPRSEIETHMRMMLCALSDADEELNKFQEAANTGDSKAEKALAAKQRGWIVKNVKHMAQLKRLLMLHKNDPRNHTFSFDTTRVSLEEEFRYFADRVDLPISKNAQDSFRMLREIATTTALNLNERLRSDNDELEQEIRTLRNQIRDMKKVVKKFKKDEGDDEEESIGEESIDEEEKKKKKKKKSPPAAAAAAAEDTTEVVAVEKEEEEYKETDELPEAE